MAEASPLLCTSAPIDALAMATQDASCDFKPMAFQRRPMGPEDVVLDMKYCGVCHTDLHVAANHFGSVRPTRYPCVPGHELAGVCVAVGDRVQNIAVGDHVGVGCMVDSCLECENCLNGDEHKCKKQNVGTYNGDSSKHGRADTVPKGQQTFGGYTNKMVVHWRFAIKIPKSYPLQAAGPVMCAGITMYDPLKKHGVQAGTRVGVVGLGGLGLMGVKLAAAMGAEVTAISQSRGKAEVARSSGAKSFVVASVAAELEAAKHSLDVILNTVPAYHDYTVYSSLLKSGGKQVLLGAHAGFMGALVTQRLKCCGCLSEPKTVNSLIGGIKNTQEVIDLCAEKSIVPEFKVVPVTELNWVYEQLDGANQTGIRYVLDIGSLNEGTAAKCDAKPPQLLPNQTGASTGTILYEVFRQLAARLCC